MTNITVREILDQAQEIHHRLGEHFHQLADDAEKDRLRMLLHYLQRHESSMEESIREFEALARESVLNTWYLFVPETDIQKEIEAAHITETSSPSDIIGAAIRLDNCLIKLYEKMADTAASEDVRNLFEELLRMEQKEEFRVVRDTLEVEDL